MSSRSATTVAVAPSRTAPPRARARARTLPVGWPLVLLYVGMPLWWLLGARSFAFLFFAGVMAVHLLRRSHLVAPRGFGLWLLFLVTVVVGVGVLYAVAPLSVPDGSSTRVMTFGYRLLWYLALTVVLLYVGNLTERELPTTTVIRSLAALFVVTVAGGYVGMLLPHLSFTSPIEALVPHGISGNAFFRSVTHPVAAQVQGVLGYEEARPAAPFGHTNDWGANYGSLLPFFAIAWFGRDAGWRRPVGALILLASLVPVIYSLNRGLWLGIAAVACFIALRLAAKGRFWAVGAGVAAMGVVALLVVATPLGRTVEARLANPHSNEARANLSTLTVRSTFEGSPVVGFGSTRNVPANFNSIAGGATEDCPRCSPPAMGTQGHVWLVLFSQGLVGLATFLGFVAYRARRAWHSPAPPALAALCTVVFLGVTFWVYDLLDAPLFTLMVALGLAWRLERQAADGAPGSPAVAR